MQVFVSKGRISRTYSSSLFHTTTSLASALVSSVALLLPRTTAHVDYLVISLIQFARSHAQLSCPLYCPPQRILSSYLVFN